MPTAKKRTKTVTMMNGVPVDRLEETIEAVSADPELGKSEFRARNRWIRGGHNRSTITDFYCAGEERVHEKPFELDNGEHEVLLGNDDGPNPVEQVLHGLAGCVTTTFVYYAAAQGIEIDEVESELTGHLDLQGMLGTAPVKPGYTDVQIKLRVKSDAPVAKLQELATLAQNRSPVLSTVSSPVDLDVELERM